MRNYFLNPNHIILKLEHIRSLNSSSSVSIFLNVFAIRLKFLAVSDGELHTKGNRAQMDSIHLSMPLASQLQHTYELVYVNEWPKKQESLDKIEPVLPPYAASK
jgi:hypothetical protein